MDYKANHVVRLLQGFTVRGDMLLPSGTCSPLPFNQSLNSICHGFFVQTWCAAHTGLSCLCFKESEENLINARI